MVVVKWTLEFLGWVVTFGIGRPGPEFDADESEELSGVSHTGGAYERATGPYSADFLDEEPYYPEDRFGFNSGKG